MNTHDHQHDDALPGEEELQALYRSLPRKEPTPALDQAVRAAAAEAVHPQTRRRMARWPVAAASAAVVVLAVGLGLRMREQPAHVQASAPVTLNAPVNEPQISAPTSGAAMARANGSDAPLAATTAHRPRIASATRRTHQLAKAVTTSPEADALGEQAYAPQTSAPAAVMAPAPAPAPAIAMAAAPAPTPPSASADISAAPEARSMAMKTMAMPAAPATMAARMMAPAAADATAANPGDTPAQELDKIRALFAQHRRDEALQRVSTFRQAHPNIALPADLRAQLPDHE